MNLHWIDLALIAAYLIIVAFIGFWVKKRATAGLDDYYLAGRNIPWWMLGFAGCSSYIDIGGTMAMVGALYYLGLKSIWMTHIFWGWFIIAFYMAFQAKWIRRSGVMTFAEWNKTRFGDNADAEKARIAAAIFLLVLMIFNLMYIAVGIGKFAEEFLPIPRWEATLIVFFIVGIYVTLAGLFGVIITDIIQTILIAVGAIILTIIVFSSGAGVNLVTTQSSEWLSLKPAWTLWSGYLETTPESYQHFYLFGPLIFAGFSWVIFRILAGPNVWDFQFFLTARSTRDAALAGGMWTVGYTLRWIVACSFLVLGIFYLGSDAGFDAEKIMPLVLTNLPTGIRGLFIAVLLAALMSTLDAMINVTSSVVINDFFKRYFLKNRSEKYLVKMGQLVSIIFVFTGFAFSLVFDHIISAWEVMLFVVVTMIIVPATMRWHWWRFSAKAFVWSMIASALVVIFQKVFFGHWPISLSLSLTTLGCLVSTVIIGFLNKPTDIEVLVDFYKNIRPFGVWGPVRKEVIKRNLIPENDSLPSIDALNGILSAIFQFSLALIPFYLFLRQWQQMIIWLFTAILLSCILYFTWYKNLPARDEL
jgi:Na+/proline symporter